MRSFLLALALAIYLGAGCAARFPQDPQHTLDHARARGALRVGLLDHRPWVMQPAPDDPDGPDEVLIAAFAGELGLDTAWHPGAAEVLFEALKRYELDVVIGGISESSPWRKHVALTLPYYTSHVVVGVPEDEPPPADLKGITVAVRPASGLQEILEDRGALVVVRDDLRGASGPVAAEEWEIAAMDFRPTELRLRTVPRVMAVPPGENALIMRLEDFLLRQRDEERISQLLQEAASR